MAERSISTFRSSLQLWWLPILIAIKLSLNEVYALRPPSQGVVATTRLPTSTTTLLQASPAEENVGNVYNGYNLDTSPLQDSLKEMRESMDSIQASISATKSTLASASMTISDASLSSSPSSSFDIAEASTTTTSAALPVSSSPLDMVQMEDAPQIWNDVMAQLQKNSPSYFFPSTPSDDQYFPSSSVDSMRESLNSIQQSIQAGQAIHDPSMLLANLPAADHAATVSSAAVDAAASVNHHVPTLMDYLSNKISTKFLENAPSESSSSINILSEAKIKLSMMVSNSYQMLGLQPPEEYVKSGATITPSVSLFTAFFALLWAIGSKQMARSQAEEGMKTIILAYQRQQATLRSQLLPLTIEVSRLNDEVAELQDELSVTNAQIERLEFKRSLERDFWATKLKAKRRRVSRMRGALVTKKAQLEQGTWQHKERMETVRQHNKVVEALSNNGKIVFDQSLKVVSFLGDQLSAQHQLHQTRMEDQRLQKALKEVEEMDQLHQAQMEDQQLQDALKEVEDMDLDQIVVQVNGAATTTTNSTTSSPQQVPLYFATSQMIQP